MTANLRHAAGSLLVVGLGSRELTNLERAWLKLVRPAGIILFRRNIEDARQFLTEAGVAVDEIAPLVEGKFMSAFIRATKPVVPASGACCAPGCCAPASAEGKV